MCVAISKRSSSPSTPHLATMDHARSTGVICRAQEERTEIRPVVVRIEIFSSLKKPYYQVGKGSGHHFIYHLEYPLRENRGQQQRRGNDAPKSDADEDHCVQPFANKRRANSTGPQPASICGDL